ncbi:TetR/AcrR family transcriptional regulator [Pseudonocardia sp. NPDC049635]|uniref:TetR/AcrR family transcriptional regulator n=1 Tax=Pseudonocardia sp. NPDC049635 TaxID=3155506 RepID=UPI0033F67907
MAVTSRSAGPARSGAIVAAAAAAFHRSGYHQANVGTIAEKVGVTAPALYRHYKGKRALLAAVAEKGTELFSTALDSAIARGDTPRAVLDGAHHELAGIAVEHRVFAAVLQRDTRYLDESQRARHTERWRGIAARLSAIVRAVRSDLSVWDAELLTRAWLAVVGSPSHYRLSIAPARHRQLLVALQRSVCGSTALVPSEDEPRPRPHTPVSVLLDRASRREAIMAVASRLFRERGYQGVSIEEIAEVAQVTAPTVYSHFTNKAELMVVTQERGTAWLQMEIGRALGGAADPYEALTAVFASYATFGVEFGDQIAIVTRELHNLPAEQYEVVRRSQRDYVAELVRVVTACSPGMRQLDAAVRTHGALAVVNEITRTRRFLGRPRLKAELTGLNIAMLTPGKGRDDAH